MAALFCIAVALPILADYLTEFPVPTSTCKDATGIPT